ncbi:MAG: hypothetical protein ACXVPQ_12575 [Bacteroidia bacterium]
MREILDEIKKEMGYSNLDDAEDFEMMEQADKYDSLDAEDFEMMDNAEYAEYLEFLDSIDALDSAEGHKLLHRGRKKPLFKKGHHKRAAKKSPFPTFPGGRAGKMAAIGSGAHFKKPGTASKNAPVFASPAYIQQIMAMSKGDLNITVTRATHAINTGLPYILFNSNGFPSNFVSTIKQYLPTGVTVSATTSATGDMLLTYTDGTNTDIVTVSLSGSQISYMEFLNNMNTNFFATMYAKQTYPNDGNLINGQSQMINFGLLSAMGMKNQNSLLPRSRVLSSDYQQNIVNIFMPEQNVTTEFSFVQNIIPVNGYTIAWDVYMSKRINLNNM